VMTRMVNEFNRVNQLNYDNGQLSTRFSICKSLYKEFKRCCDNSGFGFDPEKKIPTAPDHVWVQWIEANPTHKVRVRVRIIQFQSQFKL
jgi:hypothetical protein